MAENDTQKPTTDSQTDITKAQSQQQPPNQASQQQGETGGREDQFETGQQDESELSGDQAATGQSQSDSPDAERQGDTVTQQRTDIEGGSLGSQETGEPESGFVGAEGRDDTSSELVEDPDFEKDGQGAPERK